MIELVCTTTTIIGDSQFRCNCPFGEFYKTVLDSEAKHLIVLIYYI